MVAQLGARRHYAIPRALGEDGRLERLFTDAYGGRFPWSAADRLLPKSWQPPSLRAVLDRRIDGVEASRVHPLNRLFFECRLGSLRPRTDEHRTDYWVRQNARFGDVVCRQRWGDADTVYGFNGAALEIFQEARKRGLRCVLDQTAAPLRYNSDLLRAEMERWPGWEEAPIDVDPTGVLTEREEEEWALADRVICGSDFVVKTAREIGAPVEKFRVVRYPTPKIPDRLNHVAGGKDRPLRVLFLGSVQLRKGIQYLVKAVQEHGPFDVRVVGPSMVTEKAEREIRAVADLRSKVPRSEVWDHYRWADVFVLPTLSEGSANVCHEAMSAGVPVITTAAAGIEPRPGVTIVSTPEEIGSALREFSRESSPAPNDLTVRSWDSYKEELVAAL